jgi:hypothetical protein
MFFAKESEKVLLEVAPEKTCVVTTTDTRFVFHFSEGKFYVRKVMGKDPRYGLVIRINGRKKYDSENLDLGSIFEYYHPRLGEFVTSGKVTAVVVKT